MNIDETNTIINIMKIITLIAAEWILDFACFEITWVLSFFNAKSPNNTRIK